MKVEINRYPCYTCANYYQLRACTGAPRNCIGCHYNKGDIETTSNRIPDFDLLLWTYQTE